MGHLGPSNTGRGRGVSLGDVRLVTPPPTPSWPGSGLVITPPATSICVPHASKGHALTHRQAISAPGLPGLSTASAPRTARLSSESSTNIQCGRIWRLRRICFTWEGGTAKPQREVGLKLEGLESLLPEASGVDGLGVKGGAGKPGLRSVPSLMALSSQRRHGIFQHQDLAQVVHQLFLGSPNCEKTHRIGEGKEWFVQKCRLKALGPQLPLQCPQLLGQLPAVGRVDVRPEAVQELFHKIPAQTGLLRRKVFPHSHLSQESCW